MSWVSNGMNQLVWAGSLPEAVLFRMYKSGIVTETLVVGSVTRKPTIAELLLLPETFLSGDAVELLRALKYILTENTPYEYT